MAHVFVYGGHMEQTKTMNTRPLTSLQQTTLWLLERKHTQCGATARNARVLDSLVRRGLAKKSMVMTRCGRELPTWTYVAPEAR